MNEINKKLYDFVAVFCIIFLMCFYFKAENPTLEELMSVLVITVTGILTKLLLSEG